MDKNAQTWFILGVYVALQVVVKNEQACYKILAKKIEQSKSTYFYSFSFTWSTYLYFLFVMKWLDVSRRLLIGALRRSVIKLGVALDFFYDTLNALFELKIFHQIQLLKIILEYLKWFEFYR